MAEEKKPTTEDALNAPDERVGREARTGTTPAAESGKFGVEGCCVNHYWAVVERNGELVRGRNVWRTKKVGPGQYEVIFTGDVSKGVYVATIGRPGIATEPTGQIGVALRFSSGPVPEIGKGVWVDTHDSNGASSDRAFHLSVHTED